MNIFRTLSFVSSANLHFLLVDMYQVPNSCPSKVRHFVLQTSELSITNIGTFPHKVRHFLKQTLEVCHCVNGGARIETFWNDNGIILFSSSFFSTYGTWVFMFHT